MTWDTRFLALFDKCLALYHSGSRDYASWYTEEDSALLQEIGYQPREFFDFIEDFGDTGEPTPSTALLIAAARRDYFHTVQHGGASTAQLTPDDIPFGHEELSGIRRLPRLLAKARAKLRGELHPDIMYGCGGDRDLLSSLNLHPADFLRAVWAAGDDAEKLLRWIKAQG